MLAPLAIGAALLWAYWPSLAGMAGRWADDPRYSHGYLVVAFSAVLLVLRREQLTSIRPCPSWWGVALIAAGSGLRLLGTYVYFDWLDGVSLVPCLAGLCALVWGRGALRVAAPAIAFLAFMVPLPFRLEQALGGPLQQVATLISTSTLQTLGLSAVSEGNTIVMEHARIGVVEACSGLSMMILFFALATGVAMLIQRPLVDRLLIVASAAPIAVVANIARITVTGVLHETVGERVANIVFHDLAGWLMMPLGLTLLGLELQLLAWLFIEPTPERPIPIDQPLGPEWGLAAVPAGTSVGR